MQLRTVWASASLFDRVMILFLAMVIPYDAWAGNWFDAGVATLLLFWVYISIREQFIG